eukprot:2117374-Rhodomonas_salina.2
MAYKRGNDKRIWCYQGCTAFSGSDSGQRHVWCVLNRTSVLDILDQYCAYPSSVLRVFHQLYCMHCISTVHALHQHQPQVCNASTHQLCTSLPDSLLATTTGCAGSWSGKHPKPETLNPQA